LLYLIDIVKNKEEVKQKLRKGHIVIMDRYFLSTIAYQAANNFDYEVAKVVTKLIQLPLPSVIFYIEIPLEIASRRKSKQKGIVDRFEGNTKFLTKVVNVYERLIKEQFPSSNWIKLDGTEEPGLLNKKILLKLEE
jgi:dTMP kinase